MRGTGPGKTDPFGQEPFHPWLGSPRQSRQSRQRPVRVCAVKKVGYARVSTNEQDLSAQLNALKAAGCDIIYSDHGISGFDFKRPGLLSALDEAGEGDQIVVWRLDRLGRSLIDLVKIVNGLAHRGVQFCSLMESIDTSSSGGRLIFHIMAALAEFERSLISERTRAGMCAAKAKGRPIGRPQALSAAARQVIEHEVRTLGAPVGTVAARYGVHPRTVRRALNRPTL